MSRALCAIFHSQLFTRCAVMPPLHPRIYYSRTAVSSWCQQFNTIQSESICWICRTRNAVARGRRVTWLLRTVDLRWTNVGADVTLIVVERWPRHQLRQFVRRRGAVIGTVDMTTGWSDSIDDTIIHENIGILLLRGLKSTAARHWILLQLLWLQLMMQEVTLVRFVFRSTVETLVIVNRLPDITIVDRSCRIRHDVTTGVVGKLFAD